MKIFTKQKEESKKNHFLVFLICIVTCISGFSQELPEPIITGPTDPFTNLPAILSGATITDQVYTVEFNGGDPGGINYEWTVSSPAGQNMRGQGTNSIIIDWIEPKGQQFVSVSYIDGNNVGQSAMLIINWYPFAPAIDPESIPQFVDPLPHFAAGLRVNAKAGGNLVIKTVPAKQVALSTGTVLNSGTIGLTPNAGMGNYAAYAISKDGGLTFGPAMWPAQTIEAQQGFPLTVQYKNNLNGVTYADFNILADQTLMMNGYTLTGNELTDPYEGPIPMVVHLHGGEIPSSSDGGPNSWFMPEGTSSGNIEGPGFEFNASSLSTYPNEQEAATLWYHPHDDGLTRINVYTGLAGYYLIRGADEEAARLPGWSGDDQVQEVTPMGKSPTFNGNNTYLPEIELGIQDRMFNVNGELFWPVEPTNPDIHPFWTPEFVGNVMVVNGKSWPYLSVAPRKYRFRVLEGCNARFLNMWLEDESGAPGPKITVIGGEGGLLETPVNLDPASGQTLLMAPGQRYDVIIDFTGLAGQTFTLRNNANTPYPDGDPVDPLTTGRIMQFIVNGNMVSGADPSILPTVLRPVNSLVKLTDFSGNLTPSVNPTVKRQIILNEVSASGGPAAVLINNAYFESTLAIKGTPDIFGGPTETPREGTTEIFQIINVSADAHPIHIHLLQWQLVSRQTIDAEAYMNEYINAWAGRSGFPLGEDYPGGAGSPYPYDSLNADGFLGGNPAIPPGILGPIIPANPEEQGWKDNVIVMPGEVTTFITRIAPTDRPINATPEQLVFPFDPSEGPGYVWHCHIVDHEDMSMMRPLPIKPSPVRFPQITAQPASVSTCLGSIASFSVAATSATTINYQWEVSTDGITWNPLVDGVPYTGVSTSTLSIDPAALALTNYQYRVLLTNFDGTTTSNAALLTVNNLPIPTFTAQAGSESCISAKLVYTTEPGMTNYVWTFTGVPNIDYFIVLGGTTLTNSVTVQWLTPGVKTVGVNYTDVNGCTAAVATTSATTVVGNPFKPGIISGLPTVCQGQNNVVYSVPLVAGLTYSWTYLGTGVNITPTVTNTASVEFTNNATSGILSVIAINSCGASPTQTFKVTVNSLPAQPGDFLKFTTSPCKTQSKVIYTVPKVSGVTYEWNYSGTGATIISGATTNSVTINFLNATSGTLSVKAINNCGKSVSRELTINVNQGCSMKSAYITGEDPIVSVESPIAENAIKVYPNPTSGAVTFEFQITEHARVTLDITSVTGTRIDKVFDAFVEAGEIKTVLFNQPISAGIYFYYLKWNDQMITGKFIKKE